MVVENIKYGHRFALADYARMSRSTPIWGRIPHGWDRIVNPWIPDRAGFDAYGWEYRTFEAYPLLVWKQQDARHLDTYYPGVKKTVIGAPWLYLLKRQPVAPAPKRGSLLAVPFHDVGNPRSRPIAFYADELDTLRKDFSDISVCLYHRDYFNPDVRGIFEARGYRVISNGIPVETSRTSETFLERCKRNMESHDFVTSNTLSTIVLYALSLGRPAFLWGQPVGITKSHDPDGKYRSDWQKEHMPGLSYERFDGTCYREYADQELGAAHVREVEELKDIAGWSMMNISGMYARKALAKLRHTIQHIFRH